MLTGSLRPNRGSDREAIQVQSGSTATQNHVYTTLLKFQMEKYASKKDKRAKSKEESVDRNEPSLKIDYPIKKI